METEKMIYLVTEYAAGGEIFGNRMNTILILIFYYYLLHFNYNFKYY